MNNALNLQEIDQDQAVSLTKFYIQSNKSILILGKKGVGKTYISIQSAKECGYKVNYINLSALDRVDLIGYPLLHSPGDLVEFKSPHFLPPLKPNSVPDTVIIFDEVDKCPSDVTAPLLEILQFRTINSKPINAVSCILTGNLPNERAYSNQISAPLLDRTAKYILSFSFDRWIEWAKKNNVHDLILGFLRSYPELACGKIEDTCYASPSPRGWTMASEALVKARECKITDIETISHIVSGFVGLEAGVKFKTWYEHYRKFEPYVKSLIETGNLTLDFNALTPTEKIVFVISSCYLAKQKVTQENKSKNKFVCLENLCQFFVKYKVDYEAQVIGLSNSFEFEFVTKYKLYSCKPFFDLFTAISQQTNLIKK